MRIVTYAHEGPEPAPVGQEAIARILCAQLGKKQKVFDDWHPVVFMAPTAERAREKAQAWWDAEVEKERRRQEGFQKAAEARRAKREAA